MKTGILLVLFVSVVFAPFLDAPFDEVKENNLNVIMSSKEFSEEIVGPGPIYFVNLTILTIDPSVDNRINYGRLPDVLWISKAGYTSSFEDQIFTYPLGACEDVISTRKWVLVDYRKNVVGKFYFRNITKEVNVDSNNFVIPFTREELATSENDTLLVNMSANFEFEYNIEYNTYTDFFDEGCVIDKEVNETITITKNAFSSKEYLVEGEEILYFLEKPVLKEQWFKNNRFDLVVLANKELKYIEIRKNNSTIGTAGFHEFEVETDEHGIKKIISNQTNNENGTQTTKQYTKTLPKGLEKQNKTFYIAYQINSSYEGIGNNALGLFLEDDFGGEVKIEEQLLSRALSNTELGFANSNEIELSRQNFTTKDKEIDFTYLELGAVGLLALIIFRRISR